MLFVIGHPPSHQIKDSAEVPNLQTELNYLNLFKFYCIFSDLRPPAALASGWVGVGVSGVLPHVPICMHMHTCIHTCIMLYIIEIANGCPHGGIHLSCLTCMCVCVHVHSCMHEAPPKHPHPLTPPPPPNK